MNTVNLKADAATAKTTAITNAELVAIQALRGYFEGYLEASALAILFNLSMREKEQKKFKEYVEYVSDLTNGFETPHTVEYHATANDEIMWEWGEYVDKHYKGNNKSEVYDFYFSDNSNIVDKKQIVSEWLEEFAADMRVKIERVPVSFGRTFLYVTGYSK
jgi:hypothetical protein